MRIAYLGPRGTFTEEAARAYLASRNLEKPVLVAHRTIPDVLLEVSAGQAGAGVVPVENSSEGSVTITLDYLAHEVELTIVAEVALPIRHHLLALPGTDPRQVEEVYSHPQALAQCRRHLQEMLPQAEQRPTSSTAEAARLVRDGKKNSRVAIGTALAAELYGLDILAHDLQDTPENATRFLVVGHEPAPCTGRDKTSIVFAFAGDRPGQLYKALREFAVRDINLTKLESRPARRQLGDYIFFADFAGHVSDAPVEAALAGLRAQCALVRVLGSYPQAEFPTRA